MRCALAFPDAPRAASTLTPPAQSAAELAHTRSLLLSLQLAVTERRFGTEMGALLLRSAAEAHAGGARLEGRAASLRAASQLAFPESPALVIAAI